MVPWLGLDTATSGGAISDAVRWAERIMEEIDRRHPVKPTPQASSEPYERDLAKVESWVGRGVLHTNIMLQGQAPVESRKSHGDFLFGAVYLFAK